MELLQPEQQPRLFASAINNLSSGVMISDPMRPDNPIVFINPSFTTITGYSDEEACGQNWSFLFGAETSAQTIDELNAAMKARAPFNGLLQCVRKDGTAWSNGLVVTPVFDDDGALLNFVGLVNDVSASREQLRALAARLTQVREDERTQIAREIHDVLGQPLTALKMDLSALRKRATHIPDADLTSLFEERIGGMMNLIDSTIGTIRKIATQLRPPLLDDLGLEAAAEWQVKEFATRSGIACRFVSTLDGTPISPDSSTALFRILSETLTNVARHAEASRIVVSLSAKKDSAILEVRDNGRGIGETANTKSLGLLGMRERALLVGGTVEIKAAPRKGTIVSAQVPLEGQMPADIAEELFR